MAYTKTTWVNNQAPAINADNLNKIEDGIYNSVRYADAQTLTDAQKTQARANIGAAPSGGSVMETSIVVSAESDSESYDTFCAKLDAVLATMPDGSVKFLRVYPPQYYGFGTDMCALYKVTNDYASVYTIGSYNYARQGFRMIKRKHYSSDPAGQWDPLEYINPEMTLGVEYRTTERYQGKPVYVKAIDFGALPNATTKSVGHGASNVDVCIRATGSITSGDKRSIPFADSNGRADIFGGITQVTIKTDYNFSSLSAYATIWYTKTTD